MNWPRRTSRARVAKLSCPGERLWLQQRLSEIDLFVLPSLGESFPNVIGEAMACGLPILVTKNCQGPDVIDNEKNGFIIEEQNSDIIAEKIKFFYDNPQMLVNMSNSASNYAHTKMTIDFQVSKIVDFLEKSKWKYFYKIKFINFSKNNIVKNATSLTFNHGIQVLTQLLVIPPNITYWDLNTYSEWILISTI